MLLNCPTARLLLCAGERTPRPLDFLVVGLNHQSASLGVREKASVPAGGVAELLANLRPIAAEAMVVATCNRTEIYLSGLRCCPRAAFNEAFGGEFDSNIYLHQGRDAVIHLYRVVAGLDSLVVGETQIQGQVKRALADAVEHKTAGKFISKVVQGALAAGKRVRTETSLSDRVVSVSSAAVELAAEKLNGLQGKTALVIGAGETAELTLKHLCAAGVGAVLVSNRTEGRAADLAAKFDGRVWNHADLPRALEIADVVIASTGAQRFVLSADAVSVNVARRAGRPLFLFDISMPRNIDPQIGELSGVFLSNLDDINAIVNRNLSSRRLALPQAEAIIREAAADLVRWHLTREAQLRSAAG